LLRFARNDNALNLMPLVPRPVAHGKKTAGNSQTR